MLSVKANRPIQYSEKIVQFSDSNSPPISFHSNYHCHIAGLDSVFYF